MTGWRGLLSGWQFRTRYPSFQEGQQVTAYVTGYDEETGEGEIRVGDSLLRVKDLDPERLDEMVSVRVTEFDSTSGVGRARIPREGD